MARRKSRRRRRGTAGLGRADYCKKVTVNGKRRELCFKAGKIVSNRPAGRR